VARTASKHSRSSGKRNRIRERWAQRSFSPADLLNLWEPIGAWERHRGLAYEHQTKNLGVSGSNPFGRAKGPINIGTI
jgi:hypothetical protein